MRSLHSRAASSRLPESITPPGATTMLMGVVTTVWKKIIGILILILTLVLILTIITIGLESSQKLRGREINDDYLATKMNI
jgi:hypothetical protein